MAIVWQVFLKQQIIDYLTDHGVSRLEQLCEEMPCVSEKDLAELLHIMRKENLVAEELTFSEGGERNFKYRLKA